MPLYYPNGLSNHVNAYPILKKPLYTSSPVIFIDSTNGDNSNDGLTPQRAKKTLAATSLSYSNQIAVLMDGFAETLTSEFSSSGNNVTLIGETVLNGEPTAEITNNQSNGRALSYKAYNLFNIKFKAESQSNSQPTVLFFEANGISVDCVFEDDSNSDNPSYDIENLWPMFIRCTWRSVAVSSATRPDLALRLGSGGTAGDLCRMEDCTLDNGPYGRTTYAMAAIANKANFKCSGLTLKNEATFDHGWLWEIYGPLGIGAVDNSIVSAYSYTTVHVLPGAGTIFRDDKYIYTYEGNEKKVIYVDSATGDDTETSPYSPSTPFATISKAADFITTNTYTDMIIVVADGHTENISSTIVFDQNNTAVIGGVDSKINVTADVDGISVTADGCTFASFEFRALTTLSSNKYIFRSTSTKVSSIQDCEFYCDGNIGGAALYLDTDSWFNLKNVTIQSTSTDQDSLPVIGLRTNKSLGLILRDVVFDGGNYGFSGLAFSHESDFGNMRGQNVVAKNGCDINIGGFTGHLFCEIDESSYLKDV